LIRRRIFHTCQTQRGFSGQEKVLYSKNGTKGVCGTSEGGGGYFVDAGPEGKRKKTSKNEVKECPASRKGEGRRGALSLVNGGAKTSKSILEGNLIAPEREAKRVKGENGKRIPPKVLVRGDKQSVLHS